PSSITTPPVAATIATVASPVGTYPITLTGGASPNYIISNVPGTLTVTQAVLTATAVDTFRLYGAINPTFRIRYTGFVNGDGIGNITQPSASSAATITSHAGTYPITLSGGSALNYQLALSTGTLTVRGAPLIVKAVDIAIFKGDPLPAFTSTYTGFLNGDLAT